VRAVASRGYDVPNRAVATGARRRPWFPDAENDFLRILGVENPATGAD
jgi:hypothetical protein